MSEKRLLTICVAAVATTFAMSFTASAEDAYIQFAGTQRNLVIAPASASVRADSPRTFTAYAPGAVAYRWTRNDEAVDGGANGGLVVTWHRAKTPDSYSVTPVYLIKGEEVEGDPSTFTVENLPVGTAIILR